MAASGFELVSLAQRHIGERYVLGSSVPKDDPSYHGPWDCAEFCSWVTYQATGELFGCNAGTKNPSKAESYTGYWETDARTRGEIVSIDVAARTLGAFILRVPRPHGHIVISDGNGGTIEAMGAAYGVRRASVGGRAWDFGILPRFVDYSRGSDVPVPPSQRPLILRRSSATVPDASVEALQNALVAAGQNPGPIDGFFGPLTENAVIQYQAANGLEVDGEVGPITGNALGMKSWGRKCLPPYTRIHEPQPIPRPIEDWPEDSRPVKQSIVFEEIRQELKQLWDTMLVRPERQGAIRDLAAKILSGRSRYENVAARFPSMPWQLVAVMHAMECGCSFTKHLHNGDSLSSRTIRWPPGRPKTWSPSSPWEESADDALRLLNLEKVTNWSLERVLYEFERFNGFGPRRRFGQASAYLWSFSNHYVRGKYVADHVWDPDATSKQVGAAVALKAIGGLS